MNAEVDWLPPLIRLEDFEGDWPRYLEAIYDVFRQDFIDDKPYWNGKRLSMKRHPMSQGKEATFWHVISEGSIEENRVPEMRRCERVGWPRPLIENASDPRVKFWTKKINGEDRIHIWFEEEDFVVVLADRKGYILLWTAFLVEREHTKRKLQQDSKRYGN